MGYDYYVRKKAAVKKIIGPLDIATATQIP